MSDRGPDERWHERQERLSGEREAEAARVREIRAQCREQREQQEQAARERAEQAALVAARSRRLVIVHGFNPETGQKIDGERTSLAGVYNYSAELGAQLEAHGYVNDRGMLLNLINDPEVLAMIAAQDRAAAEARMTQGGRLATAAAGAAAVGFVAGGGLMPSSASTKRNPVSWSDRIVGDGGNCTVYQRADGRFYVLDRYGRKGEGKTRVHGPAKFDSRSKVRGVR